MTRTAPARPALLRELNDRTVLDVLLADGPTTRADLVARTGLSKPTVAEVVGRLEGSGLLVSAGERAGRPGPNGRMVDVDASRTAAAAVIVEPRAVRADLVDARGTVLASAEDPAGARGRPAPETVAALLSALRASSDVATVGDVVISVPGSYDAEDDVVRHADRVPSWTVRGLHAALTGALGGDVSVRIDNDANLALVAEGAAAPAAGGTRALLWLGSGIGLATEIDGQIYRGASGGAGEVGYVPVPGAPVRGARRPAEFQDLVGPSAVLALARAHGVTGRTGPEVVARAAAAADPASQAFLDELAVRVATGLSIIVAVLDPGVVVLGGPTGLAGGATFARRTERALRSTSRLRCAVVAGAVAGDPVLAGARVVAARAARDRLLDAVSVPPQTSRPAPARPTETHRAQEASTR